MTQSLYLEVQSAALRFRRLLRRIKELEQRVSDLEDNQPPKDQIVTEMVVTRDNIADAIRFSNGWFGRVELLSYLTRAEEQGTVCKIHHIVPMEWRVSY